MYKEIADSYKDKVKESKEIEDFMDNIKDDLYYEIAPLGKSLKGSQIKKMYYATKK